MSISTDQIKFHPLISHAPFKISSCKYFFLPLVIKLKIVETVCKHRFDETLIHKGFYRIEKKLR